MSAASSALRRNYTTASLRLRSRWHRHAVLSKRLIESGRVVGSTFPVALNPALAKTIGTMMKIDYQRAVLLRIPRMDAEPDKHYRPTVFICDEYQNFATVGGDNPTGDERFLSLSRQPSASP
jgi:hypothetical protein